MSIYIEETVRQRILKMTKELRIERIILGIDMSTPGIEISPLYNPITDKSKHNVYYTDYTSAEESRKKHADYEHDEIVDLDFIWDQKLTLSECIPAGNKFEWAIASHVLEHVPDPIGWINEILDTLNDRGILSLVLPNADLIADHLRKKTEASDLIESWLYGRELPGPSQLYDFLRNTISKRDTSVTLDGSRHYTKKQAIDFVIHSWTTGEYLDAHCSVFSPASFIELIEELALLGIMNVKVVEFSPAGQEFYVKLQKMGPPSLLRPQRFSPYSSMESSDHQISNLTKDLQHARTAFNQAIEVQEELKKEIEALKKGQHYLESPDYQFSNLTKDLQHARTAFNQAVEVQEELKKEIETLKKGPLYFLKHIFTK
ncbi:class I SAM-dependent methyltransferase [Dickeya fangzhongdai]|uniref:class I SAM-dependent methyltransferase n=1 Tax=Dickeya fangzhongdai TaxID=1778540 RepID=UPI0026DF2A1A|nr:methyltransferase domain-containing protein [Dickeya fangzhongdai]WKV52088.1 methyltransferase domain-containing protein [Dickeya fangzhongdai]